MAVDPRPIAESEAVASVNAPLRDICVEIFILIELCRNTVEPLEVHFRHFAVDHEPVIAVR